MVHSTTNKIYEPMSIVIGLCVAKNNGNCAGPNAYDSSTVFPGIMYVDFVNVYKKSIKKIKRRIFIFIIVMQGEGKESI